MSQDLVCVTSRQAISRGRTIAVPALFADAGDKAASRLIEFLTANIRNKNTRTAYALAVRRFSEWCETRNFRLDQLTPIHVAAYVEELGRELAKPSVKQHLAAIRMLFDYLVIGQVVPHNPAASVRGPKYISKKGKTPVLTQDEARALFAAIDTRTIAGLRDRASYKSLRTSDTSSEPRRHPGF